MIRTRCVATNLVNSLELEPVRCATMLCRFGQTRNCSVAIHCILRGSATTRKATGDYVAVLRRFGRKEKPVISTKNELRTSLVLFAKVFLFDTVKSQVSL